LRDQLHEKVKENKRLKENFDTLKMANDTLSKEVCKTNAEAVNLRGYVVCCIRDLYNFVLFWFYCCLLISMSVIT